MAWLPRNEFRSPTISLHGSSSASTTKRRRSRSSSTVSTKQPGTTGSLEPQSVLPRLWDSACGAIISQSLNKKRLFSEPRKLLLPITEEDTVRRRAAKVDSGAEIGTSSSYPMFASQLSPVSEILQNAKSILPESPPVDSNPSVFSDDSNVKFTPNIAKLRFANALRKSAESRHRHKKARREKEREGRKEGMPQRTQEFSDDGQRPRSRSRSISSQQDIFGPAEYSSSSDDSSSLLGGRGEYVRTQEWSP